MTSVSLAHRLCRRLQVNDVTELPASDALDVLDAINTALRDFHDLSPTEQGTRPKGATFRAPDATRTITIVDGAIGFGWVSSAPTPLPLGNSIAVAGDSRLNQLVEGTQLRFSYNGTTGNQTVTIYGDAARIGTNVARLTSPPCRTTDGRQLVSLCGYRREERSRLSADVGAPVYYWLETIEPDEDGEPYQVLRVWPLPDQLYDVVFEAELYATELSMRDLTSACKLPIPAPHVTNIIFPLADGELSHSPLYKADKKDARERAALAKARLNLLHPTTSPAEHFVGTPEGW